MESPRESLSIVMAAYNEEEALPRCAARTVAFLREEVARGELIIVDDGSSDGTGALIDELARREPEVRACHLERNSGMGAALLRGFAEAREAWVTILPADGQLDAFDLPLFFAAAGDADIVTSVYGNRRYSAGRWALSLGLRALTVPIVGTYVPSDGAYLIRRDVLRALGPRSRSFMLNLEIPIRAKRGGFRVRTVTTDVHERIAGASKAVTPGRVLATAVDQLALRLMLERERLTALMKGRGRAQRVG